MISEPSASASLGATPRTTSTSRPGSAAVMERRSKAPGGSAPAPGARKAWGARPLIAMASPGPRSKTRVTGKSVSSRSRPRRTMKQYEKLPGARAFTQPASAAARTK